MQSADGFSSEKITHPRDQLHVSATASFLWRDSQAKKKYSERIWTEMQEHGRKSPLSEQKVEMVADDSNLIPDLQLMVFGFRMMLLRESFEISIIFLKLDYKIFW